mgnify:CR=1 FL=1
MKLNRSISGAVRRFSYWIANGTVGYPLLEGIDYFEKLTKDNDRVSLISADGTVLADTQADINELENHADREEIKEAAASGTGHSVRYSATMTEKTVYYA